MLSPIIKEPVYECTEFIRIHSIQSGYAIVVQSGNETIGESEAKSGSVIVKLKRPLTSGETIKAVAMEGSKQSKPSAPVEVQQLPPLSPPLAETTLYVGAICIHAWGLIPGSTIRAWNGIDLLGRGIAYDSFIRLPLNRPLMGGDAVRLEAEMCGKKSAKTAKIVPIMPYGSGPYAEKLPPPAVKETLLACQRVVGVKGLLPGARIKIFADNTTGYDQCAPTINGSFLLGPELKENQLVTAQQSFDSLNLKSDLSDSVRVGSPKNLIAPMICEPVSEGNRSVFVLNLENSVKVEITVDGKSIGRADYAGDYEFDLGYELKSGQKIKAGQGLCGNWTWSKEVTVKPLPKEVLPPKLEEPLYPCANIVKIADKIEGSLVKIYADHIFIGNGKMSLINIAPHLVAKQKITATQTVGNITSKHCNPVVVKDTPPDLPAPKLDDPIDSCSSYVTVSNLLPGARVNIFWNKLLIGATEALNKIVLVSVSPQPWPGTKIHANQSMCMLKSTDSKTLAATGYIMVKAIGTHDIGSFDVLEQRSLRLKTKCPVNVDTKVTVSSVKKLGYKGSHAQWEDAGVISIKGSGEYVIPSGKSSTDFMIKTVKQGFCWLKVTADHFIQVRETRNSMSPDGLSWNYPGLEKINVYTVTGPKVNPDKIEITEGESFTLKFTLNPIPWAACDIGFEPWPTNSPLNGRLSFQPKKVVVPAGQKSGTVKITTLKKGPATGDLYVRPEYYLGSPCHITIKAAPPPLPKKPTVTQKTYKQLLDWYAGKYLLYVMGQVYPIPNGKLKKVRNINTNWGLRYHLWFPKYPYTTDDAFDPKKGYMLKYGDEATPSQLGLPESMGNGFPIGATPWFVDSNKKGPVYVELHYEIHK